MKISTEVNQLANQYFFIANLSCWHKSCRLTYNQIWLRDNPLTEQEKSALSDFSKIHQKYSFDEGAYYLGRAFFLHVDPWAKIKQKTKSYNRLKEIFTIFEPRFSVIWENDLPALKKYQSIIESFFLDNQKIVSDIDKNLTKLFCLDKPIVDAVRVVLLLSVGDTIGGGANIKPEGVTLEVSGWHKEDKKIISVLCHELVHLCYENYAMLPAKGNSMGSSIREAIIAGLFPNGYLANKYLGVEKINKYTYILKDYIEQSKPVDEELINLIKKEAAR